MIFIFPPTAKLSEPPAGIARLAGALRHHGISVRAVDMNLEGFRYLYGSDVAAEDHWSNRALKRRALNEELLSNFSGYGNIDRYRNAVLDMNRVLKLVSAPSNAAVTLANYKSFDLTPVKSRDLLEAAEHPEKNIYYPYFKKRFEELAGEEGGLHTVGFSMNYLNQALTTFAMIGYLRKTCKNVRIILGGGLVTSWMRKPGWDNPFTDLVHVMIAGEGEKPLLELYGIENPDPFYLPDYSDFANMGYLAPGLILPYCASSGCYWRKCTFCPERAEKNPYSPVTCSTAVEQLNRLVETHDPSMVHIVDNAVSPSFLKKLADSGFKTPWYAFARVTKHLADKAFCRALKESGCRMLKLGLESGDPRVLAAMNKGVDLKLVSEVLHNLKDAGIKTYVYLLFGTPAETEAAARKTTDFTVAHSTMTGFLNIAVFNLPYFAPEAETLATQQFYDGDLSLYREFSHPSGWNRANIRHFLDKEFKRHPDIAEIIHRDPPVFNSNHAAFF